jgi:hypothetical protein
MVSPPHVALLLLLLLRQSHAQLLPSAYVCSAADREGCTRELLSCRQRCVSARCRCDSAVETETVSRGTAAQAPPPASLTRTAFRLPFACQQAVARLPCDGVQLLQCLYRLPGRLRCGASEPGRAKLRANLPRRGVRERALRRHGHRHDSSGCNGGYTLGRPHHTAAWREKMKHAKN